MSSKGTLEHLVEGTFRALLICSAIYFGAKYAPYVLKLADGIKEKIVPGSATQHNMLLVPGELKIVPESLQYSDPKLYNAIHIDRYVTSHGKSKLNRTPINDYEK